ncbi:GAF domain-containing protein A [Glaciecola punicea ACAM 611]|jgi:L-methionine (R)-S-oxide reductase|uniref:GAF domain-containing protein A n=1 Tax=Glaciecola punicea ACAM 611 TaxID=1121923 RepID=H5T9F2_9ALTE|nr:GAF domain-containing protein [Glaciecola punicea]OFA33198.1 GAF domain-containing protein [Glaciecola punicea]GAB54929.1 GAF domain-containing protein A [Glaciecola punicea ACAM 611]
MNSKVSQYKELVSQVSAITAGETDSIANMANISAILFNGMSGVNWAGFYIYKDEQLVLGPFQGNPACIRIPLDKGICGRAATTKSVQVIENVHDFAGHIACDAASNSEVVVPIIKNGQLIGVLDVDSPSFARFDNIDAEYLSKVVDILTNTLN